MTGVNSCLRFEIRHFGALVRWDQRHRCQAWRVSRRWQS